MSGQIENLVTSCPQCNSLVGLPSVMSLDAVVRCPLCGHKYTLRSRLPQSIPQLELVVNADNSDDDDSLDSEPIDPTAKLQVNEILRKNAKLNRRKHRHSSRGEDRRQHSDSTPNSNTSDTGRASARFQDFQAVTMGTVVEEAANSPDSTSWQDNERASLQTAGELAEFQRKIASRNKSKRRSSRKFRQLIEFAKIGIGALMALPVAQLIIWWVLSVDPLKLAPTVSKAVPFIVPAKVLESADEE